MTHSHHTTQWIPIQTLTSKNLEPRTLINTTHKLSHQEYTMLKQKDSWFSVETILANHEHMSNEELHEAVSRIQTLSEESFCFCMTKLYVHRKMSYQLVENIDWFSLQSKSENVLHVMAMAGDFAWSKRFTELVDKHDANDKYPLFYVLTKNSSELDGMKFMLLEVMQKYNRSLFKIMVKNDITKLVDRDNVDYIDVKEMIEFHAYNCIKVFLEFGEIEINLHHRVFVIAVANQDDELALKHIRVSYQNFVPSIVKQFVDKTASHEVLKAIAETSPPESMDDETFQTVPPLTTQSKEQSTTASPARKRPMFMLSSQPTSSSSVVSSFGPPGMRGRLTRLRTLDQKPIIKDDWNPKEHNGMARPARGGSPQRHSLMLNKPRGKLISRRRVDPFNFQTTHVMNSRSSSTASTSEDSDEGESL